MMQTLEWTDKDFKIIIITRFHILKVVSRDIEDMKNVPNSTFVYEKYNNWD